MTTPARASWTARIRVLLGVLAAALTLPLSAAFAQATTSAGAPTVAAPMRHTWFVAVNGRALPGVELRPMRASATGPGDFLVPVSALARALAALDGKGGRLVVRGRELAVTFPDSLGNAKGRMEGPCAADSLDNWFIPAGRASAATPLSLVRGGTLSTNVQRIEGRAYIPLTDLARALGGEATLGGERAEIRGGGCATCPLKGP